MVRKARNAVNVAERLVVAGSAVVDDVLSAEEASRLLTAARGDRLEALGTVLLGTGLRKGERWRSGGRTWISPRRQSGSSGRSSFLAASS